MTTPSLPSPPAEIEPESVRLDMTLSAPIARALLRIVRELPSDYIDKLASDQEELFAMLDAHEALMHAFIRAGLAEPVQLSSDQDDFDDAAVVRT